MVKEVYVIAIYVVYEDFMVGVEIQNRGLKIYRILIVCYRLLNDDDVRITELISNVVVHFHTIHISVINFQEHFINLGNVMDKVILELLDKEKVSVNYVDMQKIGI